MPRTNEIRSSAGHGKIGSAGMKARDEDMMSLPRWICTHLSNSIEERGRGGEEMFASLLRRILLPVRFSDPLTVEGQAHDR